jgi:hypothetical protein
MAEMTKAQEARIRVRIEEVRREYHDGIIDLLKEMNERRLLGKGQVASAPVVERTNIRWNLTWKEKLKISYDLNVVIGVEDDGKQARVGRVWVHRHASTPLDYEDHTPTSRMRRLSGFSMKEIREAVEAELR